MTPRVLLVEDDVPLRRSLLLALADEGFAVREAGTGAQALAGIDESPDAVVLDLGLPDVEGVELCALLRERTPSPILVHSVSRAHDDLTRTLAAGADDYLTKPFPVAALADELRALLSRPSTTALELDGLRVDLQGVGRTSAGARVPLSSIELRLLDALAAHPGQVVQRETLLERAWGTSPAAGVQVLEARVLALQAKVAGLGRTSIVSTGSGYRLHV